jgi:hypothetical protein
VGLIEEFDLLGAVSLIPHNIFYPLFGRHPQREIRNPYVLSFFGIIANVAGYMHQAGIEDKIEFVFDYQPTSISQVLEGWELFKQNAPAKFRKFLTEHPPNFHRHSLSPLRRIGPRATLRRFDPACAI